ncbi:MULTISPECIES: helix-turn-helix domain-containing protein [Kitasatospora]|uniref:helix-turn-helix domain-containing protein n=1 Tax=Kitasatospora TaxID=2063 RepID=UPI00069031D5|nr:helix-turn-helix transcriptional regulator [Kitasatospora sp. NRRL B-11411]
MRWDLRRAAADRGIWTAVEMHRRLAQHGLVISTGKMSGLWSGQPISLKLADLDAICAALACGIGDLLIPERTGREQPVPAADPLLGGPAA